MCFSLGHSLAFTALGCITTIYTLLLGHRRKFVKLVAFLTLMEALQTLQYLVVDDCASKANQILTLLGVIHIAFQPYFVNSYLFSRPYPAMGAALPDRFNKITYDTLHLMTQRMCLAAALLLCMKLLPSLFTLLDIHDPSVFAPYLGQRVAETLTTNTCSSEMLCGEKLCSLSGQVHLAWSLPMMGTGYYVPSFALHFQIFFGLGVLFGGAYIRAILAFVFALGPLLTETLLWSSGLEARRLEWPAVWCFYSVAQVLAAFASEVYMNGMSTGQWSLSVKGWSNSAPVQANHHENGTTNGVHKATKVQ